MKTFRLQLNSGMDMLEVASSFQKYTKRGQVEQALYFARELYLEGHDNYIWKRIIVCALEDIGLANIDIFQEIYFLHQTYCQIKPMKKDGYVLGWFNITKAIHLICSSPKNGTAYRARVVLEYAQPKINIKGKKNLLTELSKNWEEKEEHSALSTMFNYLERHRMNGFFEEAFKFSLIKCSTKVSNFVRCCGLFFTEMLNKKKYQMQVTTIVTLVLCRASRNDNTLRELAAKSIKAVNTYDIPPFAKDHTTSEELGLVEESDLIKGEVLYKADAAYIDMIAPLYKK